jgi:hypothetical protein
MSNQAHLSIWLKDFPEESMLERFGDFLAAVPFSARQPGFTHLEIHAVDSPSVPTGISLFLKETRLAGSHCRSPSSLCAMAKITITASGKRMVTSK